MCVRVYVVTVVYLINVRAFCGVCALCFTQSVITYGHGALMRYTQLYKSRRVKASIGTFQKFKCFTCLSVLRNPRDLARGMLGVVKT